MHSRKEGIAHQHLDVRVVMRMQTYVPVRLVQNEAVQAVRLHLSNAAGSNKVQVHLHKAEERPE